MTRLYSIIIGLALTSVIASIASAQSPWSDGFDGNPQSRWSYFADTVMGGKSTGGVTFFDEGGESFARLEGVVTTANNGGFIQFRNDLTTKPTKGLNGVRIVVKGNNQEYYIHLRTRGTRLPWQFYQAAFFADSGWNEISIPFSDFEPSGRLLRKIPLSETLKSVGVVAYGREHIAKLDINHIGFY